MYNEKGGFVNTAVRAIKSYAKIVPQYLGKLSSVPIVGGMFRLFLAAGALGDSSRAIETTNYKHAYGIVQQFENDEIDDPCLSHCQYYLGYLLFHGLGTKKNIKRAILVFECAASNGYRDAIDYMKCRAELLGAGVSNEDIEPKL
ncbi:MAG: SEL1-like repeat protein [Candidatus Thiodiazotropha sp. (ex Lucinoma borealis)]|nr:SEL1-like repeat protein [Candidatus Thiodiazotropha sp. (ex Lucinoma borealis)]